MTAVLLAVGSFLAMEGVSYALHRWVMHGFGYGWHRSHHQVRQGRWEANDRYPLVFASIGVLLFALGSGPFPPAWWMAVGVTAYGAVYFVVHEVVIHRRLSIPVRRGRYLRWLAEAHRDHHRGGGEPFGMLLPLVRRPRSRSVDSERDQPTASEARSERRSRASSRARL